VQRSLADHVEATTRIEQADSTERERTPRQIAELSQQMVALGRVFEATNGRLLALAEEVRHLRDERAPVVQAIDELQRTQLSLQSRVGIVDDLTRRFSAFQSVAEQSDEKLRNDLGRLDNLHQLLDLRVARDLAELRRVAEEWFSRTEERMKPLLEAIKQVSVMAEYRKVVEQRHAAVLKELEEIHVEISHLDTQSRADRAGMKRWTDNLDVLERRLDETGANVWKLGERFATTLSSVDGARTDLEMLVGRLDEVERKIGRFEDERQRLEASLLAVESLIHVGQKDSRDQSGSLLEHVNSEVAALRAQIDDAQRTTLDHLRGLVGVLQQQLSELESDRA
jgi:chromosome segregation ATPase